MTAMAGRLKSVLRRATLPAALLAALAASASVAAFQDLRIQVDGQTRSVRSRSHEGQRYYRVNEIARLLALDVAEQDGTLEVRGSRGRLQLTDGRPLVRFAEQYLLLSGPAWRRSRSDWYVPEDFLAKLAPLLIEGKLEKAGDLRYRVETLTENRVRVEVVNYPDHVAVIFVPSRQAPIQVQEFSRFIRVSFEEFRVVPELPATPPDPELVSDLRFDKGELYGSFEIVKGERFHNYRDYELSDPDRKVVGVYGPPVVTTAPVAPAPRPGSSPVVPAPINADVPVPIVSDEPPQVFRPRPGGRVVTIDPGHGGDNYGVHPSQEVLEKNFTLQLAEDIRRRLQDSRTRLELTRNRDINLSAQQRSSLANFNRSRAFLSLHVGGSPSADMRGPIVYVQRGIDESLGSPSLVPWGLGQQRHLKRSRELAEILQRKLNAVFGTSNEVAEAPLAVLAPVTAPAVLVEAGFLTNEQDRRLLDSPESLGRIGAAVAEALEEFLE